MKTEEIKKQVQIIALAKTNAEAAELTARQVSARIQEESAKAVRTLRRVMENSERVLAQCSSEDAHHLRQMMEDLKALQGVVVDYGLSTDFRVVAHKLATLQTDLASSSRWLQRITPQD